jgi:hypothetical protein
MTYIVDLTLVLQNLFWLQTLLSPGQPLTRRSIKIAVRAYAESNVKQALRFKINQHVNSGIRFDLGPDTTLNVIEELLLSHLISYSQALELRTTSTQSYSEELEMDEDWDANTIASREGWNYAKRERQAESSRSPFSFDLYFTDTFNREIRCFGHCPTTPRKW